MFFDMRKNNPLFIKTWQANKNFIVMLIRAGKKYLFIFL
jgi:hypothetical protein